MKVITINKNNIIMVTKTEMKQIDGIMKNITKIVDKIRKRKVNLEKQLVEELVLVIEDNNIQTEEELIMFLNEDPELKDIPIKILKQIKNELPYLDTDLIGYDGVIYYHKQLR